MNMKMVYETPKMKAELFQANQYVAACTTLAYFTGWLSVFWNNTTNWFFGDNKYFMLNQNVEQQQYYYKQVNRIDNGDGTFSAQEVNSNNMLYLEYSVDKDAFILYQEAGSRSGYYDFTGSNRDSKYDINNYTQIVDGSNSLQVNTGGGPTYAAQAGFKANNDTSYYVMDENGVPVDANGNRVWIADGAFQIEEADAWYADRAIGTVEYKAEEGFAKVNS